MPIVRFTGYYPDPSPMEGGYLDRLGRPLQTLQGWLLNTRNVPAYNSAGEVVGVSSRFGRADYVSVAGDPTIKNHTRFRSPEIDKWAARKGYLCPQIVFEICDTGGAFKGAGWTHLDICTENQKCSTEDFLNGFHEIIIFGDGARSK